MQTTIRLYALDYSDLKTYKVALLFAMANVIFPQICHYFGLGAILLPIYFFTLVGAYKYGWKAGLLTAIVSPLISHLLFGMPVGIMLPIVMSRSMVLALVAGVVSSHFQKVTLPLLVLTVLSGFLLGGLPDLMIRGELLHAWQTQLVGIPGMFLQVFGGYVVLKYIMK